MDTGRKAGGSESRLARTAAEDLTSAGYPHVEVEPGWARSLGVRPDVVAWGPDEFGEFTPQVTVEVRRTDTPADRSIGLAKLSTVASSLGTPINLLLLGQQWLLADAGFVKTDPIPRVPNARPGVARVTDPALVGRLLAGQVWKTLDGERGRSPMTWDLVLDAFLQARNESVHGRGSLIPGVEIPYDVLLRAWADFAMNASPREAGEFLTPKSLGQVMARLAGPYPDDGLVIDPFAGHATGLAYAAEQARNEGVSVRVWGQDLNVRVAKTAQMLAKGLTLRGEIQPGDSFQTPLPKADVVVSAPPWGLRLHSPVMTPFGPVTGGDAATLSVCVEALKPGGRAVLYASRSWTWQSGQGAAALRQWLAAERHVVALIAVPSLPGPTRVPGLIAVIDHAEPGPTVVANLGDDWEQQLAPHSTLVQELHAVSRRTRR